MSKDNLGGLGCLGWVAASITVCLNLAGVIVLWPFAVAILVFGFIGSKLFGRSK
jgi:hypothetical protein